MVIDYGICVEDRDPQSFVMDEIAISKFKATCLAVLERVRKTRKPVRVTRFGKPIADVIPSAPQPSGKRWLGGMVGTGQVNGDIISPASEEKDWEVLRS
jgi:prevent-host-death family protein